MTKIVQKDQEDHKDQDYHKNEVTKSIEKIKMTKIDQKDEEDQKDQDDQKTKNLINEESEKIV